MNNIEYGLDASGGLMEQIQKLVAPPQSEESLKRQKRLERQEYQWRRPVKNHDYCDSCGEGGDLLCCDRCPASFHLLCHDPPLEEEDLPSTGDWLCHRCIKAPQIEQSKDDETSSTCSSMSQRSSGASSRRGEKLPWSNNPFDLIDISREDPRTPFATLVKAARYLNPAEFDLPNELTCTTQLPGTSKRKLPARDSYKGTKKLSHELDNGIVPLPAKLCFHCSKSCRRAALLQCDYCPLLFHLDCLNPPLTTMPAGRWMCPNHPENFLDESRLKSLSLTERVRLWDRFTGPVDQNAVKIGFMRKAHRQHPVFKTKYRPPRRKTVQIPNPISELYRYPPLLLPRANDPPATSLPPADQATHSQADISQEEQDEWLSAVVALQTSIGRHMAQKRLQRRPSTSSSSSTTCANDNPSRQSADKPTASVQPTMKQHETLSLCSGQDEKSERIPNGSVESELLCSDAKSFSVLNPVILDDDVVDSALNTGLLRTITDHAKLTEKPTNSVLGKPNDSVSSSGKPIGTVKSMSVANNNNNNNTVLPPRPQLNLFSGHPSLNSSVKCGLPGVVSSVTAASLAPTSPSSVAPAGGAVSLSNVPAIINLNSTLQACIDGSGGDVVELSKLDDQLIQILAWQRLQQLVPQKPAVVASSVSSTAKKGTLNGLLTPTVGSEVQARALLCPLTGKGSTVPMPYRVLTIGTGGDMDVCLTSYGHCNFISAKHACIFYDEVTRHYELLNYSEHGTTVDNVLYSCDFSDKPVLTPQPTPLVASVRKLIGKRKQKQIQMQAQKDREAREALIEEQERAGQRLTMCAKATEVRRPCNCKASSSSLIGGSGAGWEGTALLHHGSYIKVGCLQFVFSIVEQAPRDLPLSRGEFSILKTQLKTP